MPTLPQEHNQPWDSSEESPSKRAARCVTHAKIHHEKGNDEIAAGFVWDAIRLDPGNVEAIALADIIPLELYGFTLEASEPFALVKESDIIPTSGQLIISSLHKRYPDVELVPYQLGIAGGGTVKEQNRGNLRETRQRRIVDLSIEELANFANEAWNNAAKQALESGYSVTGAQNGRLYRQHSDGNRTDLGPVTLSQGKGIEPKPR